MTERSETPLGTGSISEQRRQGTKVDPSFKSKRYRDKLRTEVKELESLIPVDRPTLHRKLDSQTVYRLVIAFLRIKAFLKRYYNNAGIKPSNQRQQNNDHCHGNDTDTMETTDNTSVANNDSVENMIDRTFLNKIVDGFVLVASVDGTIMYVTEHVQHYTGFNQIDLFHRCIYGIIHPEDQSLVRDLIEQHAIFTSMRLSGDIDHRALSFFCRMKCYQGNSTGYLKFFCTGKVVPSSDVPKTPKTSNKVILLYCRPFLLHGTHLETPDNREVFWTKHDLDLKFKELEEGACALLGYSSEEICDWSLYQIVHPEDARVLLQVHMSIVESTDIQTVFLRLIKKDGTTIWVHSKGKVITKHAKKFSVVFTHCPIRDEENAFLKQEEINRRSLCWFQSGHTAPKRERASTFSNINSCSSDPNRYAHTQEYYQNCDTQSHSTSYISDTHWSNPMGMFVPSVYPGRLHDTHLYYQDACPSSWHSDQDRHSPLLPSSHLNNKIMFRDKANWSQQSRRKGHCLRENETDVKRHKSEFSTAALQCCSNNTELNEDTNYYYKQHHESCPYVRNSNTRIDNGFCGPGGNNFMCNSISVQCNQHGAMLHSSAHYGGPDDQAHCSGPTNYGTPSECYSLQNGSSAHRPYSNGKCLDVPWKGHPTGSTEVLNTNVKVERNGRLNYGSPFAWKPQNNQSVNDFDGYQQCDKTRMETGRHNTNVRFSMVCNGSIGVVENTFNQLFQSPANNAWQHPGSANPHKIKLEQYDSKSWNHCDIKSRDENNVPSNTTCPSSRVQYDVEASIHMRIVETGHHRPFVHKPELHIPEIDNFNMDYLDS